MKVFVSTTKESAATGGALLAKWARWKLSNQGSFEDMTGGQMPGMTCVAEPRPDTVKVYNHLLEAYDTCEQQVIQKGRGSAEWTLLLYLCCSVVVITRLKLGKNVATRWLFEAIHTGNSQSHRDYEKHQFWSIQISHKVHPDRLNPGFWGPRCFPWFL